MAKKASQNSLRALALAPMAGFRSKIVTVPEWEGAQVKLREPSGTAWMEWQQIISPEPPEGQQEKLSASERAMRNKNADVVLFIDVLLDDDDMPVFTTEDREQVEQIYGPVHARLLKQALDLSTTMAEAEKK